MKKWIGAALALSLVVSLPLAAQRGRSSRVKTQPQGRARAGAKPPKLAPKGILKKGTKKDKPKGQVTFKLDGAVVPARPAATPAPRLTPKQQEVKKAADRLQALIGSKRLEIARARIERRSKALRELEQQEKAERKIIKGIEKKAAEAKRVAEETKRGLVQLP